MMLSIVSTYIIIAMMMLMMIHQVTCSATTVVIAMLSGSWGLESAQSFQLFKQTVKPSSSYRISSSTLFMGIAHDYTRDTSSDTSHVDINAVNDLLGERLHARKTGDYDVADNIRDRLSLEHQVTVFDQDKLWMTGINPRPNRGGRVDNRGGRGGRGMVILIDVPWHVVYQIMCTSFLTNSFLFNNTQIKEEDEEGAEEAEGEEVEDNVISLLPLALMVMTIIPSAGQTPHA